MELKTYPKYMNHVDHDEPVRVDSKAEQVDMENKGWTTARIFKEYPKYVGDKIVHSKAEEDRLLASQTDPVIISTESIDVSTEIVPPLFEESPSVISEGQDPEVTKEIQVEGQDTARVVEKSKEGNGRRKKK